MHTTSIIERRICVEAEFLDENILDHVLNKIKNVCKNECTKEDGYILDVIKIVNIKNNYISNVNSDIVFIVAFEAEILKPDVGKQFTDKVCMIFSGGIFINVKDKFKVLIPQSCLDKYTFNSSKKTFIHNDDKTIISEDDTITIVINVMKYSKKNFSCIGYIIDDKTKLTDSHNIIFNDSNKMELLI